MNNFIKRTRDVYGYTESVGEEGGEENSQVRKSAKFEKINHSII